jgi:membrane fusion protein (multidrug efflux system)
MADMDYDHTPPLLIDGMPQAKAARRKKWFAALGIATAALAGSYYLFVDGDHVSTDNAYVNADVAQVTPQLAAPVAAVEVVNTQMVRKGDVLLRLDDSDARIALVRAEAEWQRVRRQYGQVVATGEALAAQVQQGDAAVRRAQSQLDVAASAFAKARIDLDRRVKLVDSGAISAEELTVARNAFAAAEGNLGQARAELAEAKAARSAASGSRAANAALVEGTTVDTNPDVTAARAKLEQARLDLARTVIRAPIDGVVTNRQVQVGQRVAAGTPVMTVVPVDTLYVDANFKEGQLARVRVGQPVRLTTDLYGDKIVFHGRVMGFSGGTGAAFALIPAQNATGNWIKVVQRLPVRVALDRRELAQHPLRVGLSTEAEIDVSGRS